jgi:nicotinate phosphoribosyltransferase
MTGDRPETPGSALFTDLYELKMLQAYRRERLGGLAVFDLFVRRLPPGRGFLLAAGIEDALDYLEQLRFAPEDLDYLATLRDLTPEFLAWLADFRFTGSVRAVAEGTPVFPGQPLLEVIAPIAEAQLVETWLLNQVSFQTLAATKGARAVLAARGKPVIDFGARRAQGTDAALKAARCFHLAGFHSTSNLLAGRRYGLPVTGTMAHSYIEAHDDELQALRAFAALYPDTTLLVDTYDTLTGVRRVIDLAGELGAEFRVGGIRLDSGDLAALARESRRLLDAAGLARVKIVASGGLDEYRIAELEAAGAPIDLYAVGTGVITSDDAPALDSAYKLVEYAGAGRMKLSSDKATLPGRKQVFRHFAGGVASGDVLALHDEHLPGEPLLGERMRAGRRRAAREPLAARRERATRELARLPAAALALAPIPDAYPVRISDRLAAARERVRAALTGQSRPDA